MKYLHDFTDVIAEEGNTETALLRVQSYAAYHCKPMEARGLASRFPKKNKVIRTLDTTGTATDLYRHRRELAGARSANLSNGPVCPMIGKSYHDIDILQPNVRRPSQWKSGCDCQFYFLMNPKVLIHET